MPKVRLYKVEKLRLDPKNFRHMPEKNEEAALHKMSVLDPKYFWGLAESLFRNSYIAVENIVVRQLEGPDGEALVEEGNRRVGLLKLALGLLKGKNLDIPEPIERLLNELDDNWRTKNSEIPCLTFSAREQDAAKELVAIVHGKGELAGRLEWNAVATARHNREQNAASEPELDLLEKYIKLAQNITPEQKEQWAGDYKLSILDSAMHALNSRLGFATIRDLADAYPDIPKYRKNLDDIVRDIGLGGLTTDDVRGPTFGINYGIPVGVPGTPSPPVSLATVNLEPSTHSNIGQNPVSSLLGSAGPSLNPTPPDRRTRAVPTNTQLHVRKLLRQIVPMGTNRSKLLTVKNEMLCLSIQKTPIAFCALTRVMVELAVKAYCDDHKRKSGPKTTKNNVERKLIDILNDVYDHLLASNAAENGGQVQADYRKALYGAKAELNNPTGFFSITSFNQLIHGTTFTMDESHISTAFANVFPFLKEVANS